MSTRFRFRLESLLKLRKAMEQEAQRVLAREIATLREIEKRIADWRTEHDRVRGSHRPPQGAILDLDHWRASERYLVSLERRIAQANTEREEASHRVQEARQALTKAHQAHLSLERLKERRKEIHDQEALHEELRDLDELAVLRHRFNTQLQTLSTSEVNP